MKSAHLLLAAGLAAAMVVTPSIAATTARELQSSFSAQAAAPAVPARGQDFFVARHGREWSCASCHGAQPTQPGRHAATGKPILPLAPAANPERFSDPAKVDKWFRRNCNDVVGRECTAGEKADLLAWLTSLQP